MRAEGQGPNPASSLLWVWFLKFVFSLQDLRPSGGILALHLTGRSTGMQDERLPDPSADDVEEAGSICCRRTGSNDPSASSTTRVQTCAGRPHLTGQIIPTPVPVRSRCPC